MHFCWAQSCRTWRQAFNQFWASPLSAPVEALYDGLGIIQKHVSVKDAEIQKIYANLHAYAENPENFSPENRKAILETPQAFFKAR